MTKEKAELAPDERDTEADSNEQRKPAKIAWGLDELSAAGHGSRAFLYQEIGAGRLRAVKRGRRTIVLEADRKRWVASLPTAQITYRPKNPPNAA
jgi:hypothetical protein